MGGGGDIDACKGYMSAHPLGFNDILDIHVFKEHITVFKNTHNVRFSYNTLSLKLCSLLYIAVEAIMTS